MLLIQEIASTRPAMPDHVLLGLSGGCDSTALARILMLLSIRITCVHVNHGLRGEDSDADEAFVRAFCREHALELLVYRASPGPEDRSEAWARQVRYGFFRKAMEESGAKALALAHNRNDQAETLLLHLLRGAGLDGLTGMRFDGEQNGLRIVRPLLDVPRSRLQAALEEIRQPWREDTSNAGTAYLRNRIRLELLPEMERLAPGAGERIAACAFRLQADADALKTMSAEYCLPEADGFSVLPLDRMLAAPEGLQIRVLRAFWSRAAGEKKERALSDPHTSRFLALLTAPVGSRLQLPGELTAVRGYRYLHLVSPGKQESPLSVPLRDGARFRSLHFFLSGEEGCGDGKQAQRLVGDDLVVRCRQPGDFIRPFGLGGRKSLQDYLVDRRVDQPFRDRIPLICRGSEVLVVCGVGAGAVGNSETGALYRWEGPMPWAE